ncbi:MAG: cbb3-type cytochrome c oxidase subunit I [Candidatus Thermoplasmatota archaeon]|nr:cbb3-type cytochrome c oxidase subunit I [Candidatus Thermoplasmatota archaeon]
MNQIDMLIVVGVLSSAIAVIAFLIYYLIATGKEELAIQAEQEGYTSAEVYQREEYYGRRVSASFSVMVNNDSKSLGLRYIFTSLVFLFIAGAFGVLMRVSLTDPNPTIISPVIYNILITQHATLMIYMFAIGMGLGLGYFLLPGYLRLKRDNMGSYSTFAYWIWLLGGILFIVSRSSMRWYMYPPLSLQLTPFGAGSNNWLAIIAMEMIFVGIMLASIVILKIIFMDRSDRIPLSRMPIFAWSIVFTLLMLVTSAPPLMVGLGMLFYDFFNPVFFTASTHTVLQFAILFWFWGHPIVYIAIIPFFGIMYEIISRFTGKPVYSYSSAVFSLGLLMILSELVWGHHLLNSGLGIDWVLFFTTASFIVVIPSALTIFNMIATMWTAEKIRLTVPMLFVINAIFDFIIGGAMGVMLGDDAINATAHGTYFVTGHFHFVFVGLTLGVSMAAFYLLFPTFSNGKKYNERLARWHMYITALGSFIMSFSWGVGGFLGMPRAVAGYFPFFQPYQDSAIVGGVIIGIGQLVFLYNITKSFMSAPVTDPSNIFEISATETFEAINTSGGGE